MGSQRRMTLDDRLRLTPEEEGWQLERKIAIAFAQGAFHQCGIGCIKISNQRRTIRQRNFAPINNFAIRALYSLCG